MPIRVHEMNVDLLSLSAHKMYGPKGVGALYVRQKNAAVELVPLHAMIDGGGHEGGLRSGTLNVPGIVGFGAACRIAAQEMAAESERLWRLRNRLEEGLRAGLDEIHVNGHPDRAPREQPEREFRLRGRRSAAGGLERHCGFDRGGVHVGEARAEPRAAGDGSERGAGAELAAVRPRAFQHGRGSGVRHRPCRRDGPELAGIVGSLSIDPGINSAINTGIRTGIGSCISKVIGAVIGAFAGVW